MRIRRQQPLTAALRGLCLAALATLLVGLTACGGSDSSPSAGRPTPGTATTAMPAASPGPEADATPTPVPASSSDTAATVARKSASRRARKPAPRKSRGSVSRKSPRAKARTSPGSGARPAPESAPNAGDTKSGRLAACLRNQGIDAPDDLEADPAALRRLDRTAVQRAMAGPCKKFQGALADMLGGGSQDFVKQFQKFAQCLRDEGIDIPVRFDGSGPPQGLEQVDRNDPGFIAAATTCRRFAPQGSSRGPAPG